MVVEPALLGLVDPRLGADAGRVADPAAECATRIVDGLDRGVGERDEARLVAVDVDEHPFGAPGLAVEVDLAHTAQPLPARVEDVAAGPIAVVAELGLSGKLSHKRDLPDGARSHASGRIASRRSMTDARVLLERHRPRLVYDSQEAYFADSAAIWTDSPTNVLGAADGTVLAKPPKL